MFGTGKLVEWSIARRRQMTLDRISRIECRRSWRTFRISLRSQRPVCWEVASRAGRGPSGWRLWMWLFLLLERSAIYTKMISRKYCARSGDVRTHAIIIKTSSTRIMRRIPNWEMSRSIITTLDTENRTHRQMRLSVWCVLNLFCCFLGSCVEFMTGGRELALHLRRGEE